jgi:hypothetical protein
MGICVNIHLYVYIHVWMHVYSLKLIAAISQGSRVIPMCVNIYGYMCKHTFICIYTCMDACIQSQINSSY